MATLTTNVVPHAGVADTSSFYVAASAGGDQAATGSGIALRIKNGGASPHTATLVTPGTVDGLAVADRPLTVAAGADGEIPLLSLYRDPTTGLASITYDSVEAGFEVAVVRVA